MDAEMNAAAVSGNTKTLATSLKTFVTKSERLIAIRKSIGIEEDLEKNEALLADLEKIQGALLQRKVEGEYSPSGYNPLNSSRYQASTPRSPRLY